MPDDHDHDSEHEVGGEDETEGGSTEPSMPESPAPDETETRGCGDDGESKADEQSTSTGGAAEGANTGSWKILILMQLGAGPGGSLLRSTVQSVMSQLGGLQASREPGSRLDVWLDSPGGDAHAAYKLGLYLRARFEVVNFVVVDYAKSAATLLVLAGDAIYMAPAAELGPLDTQENREGEVRMRSNLDTANMIDNVYWQVVTNAVIAGSEILQSTGLSREQTIQHVLDFSAQFSRPLLEQIDLVTVNAASTSLDVAIEYGARLLSYRHTREEIATAKEKMAQLVRGYPTHGYVIDREEARDGLGLPVRNIEDYDLLGQLEALYAGVQEQQANIVRIMDAADLPGAVGRNQDDAPESEDEPVGE